MVKNSMFDSLRIRGYRLLWYGQTVTSMSMWMEQTARSWLVYSLTRSAMQLGLVNAVSGIPMLFFGVVAGVFADRYNRKNQLIIAQVCSTVLNILLATLIFTGQIQIWHIYVIGFLAGTVMAFQQPARQAMINDLVDRKRLLNAISLGSAANNGSRIIGPAVAGILIEAIGIDMSYYFQGALYVLATVWMLRIKVPAYSQPGAPGAVTVRQSFLSSTREGLDYIIKHRVILSLMVLALAPILLGSPYLTLIPVFAVEIFHGDASTQGLLLTIGGVGAIIGALLVASLSRRKDNVKMLIGAAAGYGLGIVLFARSPVLWMALCSTFFASACMALYQSQNQTILQMITPGNIQGRVLGIYSLSYALSPLGALLAGSLATLMGTPNAVTLMGAACLVVAIGITILSPNLWRLKLDTEREKAAPESGAS